MSNSDEMDAELALLEHVQAGGTVHPQVEVSVGEWTADVDEEIAPLIRELWTMGCATYASCQRHTATGKVWIGFCSPADVESFLNAVALHQRKKHGSLWERADDWGFGWLGATSEHIKRNGDWEYHVSVSDDAHDDSADRFVAFGHPDFRLSVSVLFPRRDIQIVTERLQFHNKER